MNDIIITPRTYKKVFTYIQQNGAPTAPRGLPTMEIINANIMIRNPIDRVIPNRVRKLNIAFAIAEFYAFIFGVDDIGFFTRFVSDYDKFSTDGVKLDGAYGTRVLGFTRADLRLEYPHSVLETIFRRNQLVPIVNKLKADSDDRQAVVSIYNFYDTFGGGGKNTPCTLTLQFLVRAGKLDMITTMRSNDIHKGLPYDMFVFTMIQELVTRAGGWELGTYYHNAGSLHYYEDDKPQFEQMSSKRDWPFLMASMPEGVFKETALDFFKSGMKLVLKNGFNFSTWYGDFVNDLMNTSSYHMLEDYEAFAYYKNLLATVSAFINRKNPDETYALDAYGEINDPTLRHVIYPWLAPYISSGKYKMKGGLNG